MPSKMSPRDIFKRMAKNPAIQALRTPGKPPAKSLPLSRTGSLSFRIGPVTYGTLAALRKADGCYRLQNAKENLDTTFTAEELVTIFKDGQTERTLLRFGKSIKVSVKRSDLQKLLKDTGAI